MQQVTTCPVCHGKILLSFLSCKDFSVTKETFQLVQCESCCLVITTPQPDESELEKYYISPNYISHTNKLSNLTDLLYKTSRHLTLRWKYNLIRKHSITSKTPLEILDFGCGTGDFLKLCKQYHHKTTGVEPSLVARSAAIRNTNACIVSKITEVAHPSFDVITLWHVLEHVTKLDETMEKLKDKLKNDGTLFIAVPNLKSLDAKKYKDDWAAYDVPRHLWHFTQGPMETLLHKHNLKLISIIPMLLDAYYVSLLSEQYKNGKNFLSNFSRALVQGWMSNREAKKTKAYSSLIYIASK